ncbi:hypothetical protein Thermo_00819 [Thermoplasmatales archaeon]|nr:hypothetical protein Thermo_00819 [Thermoplasmatales archaeon]
MPRALCRKDDSKECIYVSFNWSPPHSRALIAEYTKEGKNKEVGRVE